MLNSFYIKFKIITIIAGGNNHAHVQDNIYACFSTVFSFKRWTCIAIHRLCLSENRINLL